MASEIQKIQRKVIEQGVSLGGTDAYSAMQKTLTGLSGIGTGLAQEIAVESATQQGKTYALEHQGEPKKLAPGFTAATKAYNNAYNDATTGILSLKLDGLIAQNMANLSQPGKLGPNSVGDLQAINNSTFQGFLNEVPQHLKADVSLRFLESSQKALAHMSNAVMAKNNADIAASLKAVSENNTAEYAATLLTGNKSQIGAARSRVIDDLNNERVLTGMPNEVYLQKMREINQATINGELSRALYNSYRDSGEDAAAKLKIDFLNASPEQLGITPAQKFAATEHMLKEDTRFHKNMDIGSTQAFNNVNAAILEDPTKYVTSESIQPLIDAQAQNGFNITLAQKNTLVKAAVARNKKAAAAAANTAAINQAATTNSVSIVNFKPEQINTAWEDGISRIRAAEDARITAGEMTEEQRIPNHMAEVMAARYNTKITGLTARIHARLNSPNDQQVKNGLEQMTWLRENNPAAYDDLSNEDIAFADQLGSNFLNANDAATQEKLLAESREARKKTDPVVVKMREDAYVAAQKKSPNADNSSIKEAYGIGKIPDWYRAQFQKMKQSLVPLYEVNQGKALNKEVVRRMKSEWKEDKQAGPPGERTRHSTEATPWSDTTAYLNANQLGQYLSEALDVISAHPGVIGSNIKFSEKMPRFNKATSEQDMIEKELYKERSFTSSNGITREKGRYWVNNDGVDQQVYFKHANFASANKFGGTAYQILLKDKSGHYSQMQIPKKMMIDGKETWSSEPAMVTLYPPEIRTPNYSKYLNDTAATTANEEALTRWIRAEDNITPEDFSLGSFKNAGDIYKQEAVRRKKKSQDVAMKKSKKSEKANDIQSKLSEAQKNALLNAEDIDLEDYD